MRCLGVGYTHSRRCPATKTSVLSQAAYPLAFVTVYNVYVTLVCCELFIIRFDSYVTGTNDTVYWQLVEV